MTKREFLEAACHAAMATSRGSGLPPGIAVAQAALESAWGNSRLSREANNFFGIKAHGVHRWIELPTAEFQDGASVKVRARFSRYDSMEECFCDRDSLILSNSRYQSARESAGNPEAFLRALALCWATDPGYADKVLGVYHSNELAALDSRFAVTPSVQESRPA